MDEELDVNGRCPHSRTYYTELGEKCKDCGRFIWKPGGGVGSSKPLRRRKAGTKET